ncbi:glycosyltransferase [Klebsiella oxytoca]|nr:glycosyltransferase [Klebsiella oxytoca]
MSKLKIMVVNTLYYPYHVGGAEISVQILCETLTKRGHDVQVVCLHQEKDRKKDIINGVKVVYLPLDNIYWPYDGQQRSSFERLRWHLKDIYNCSMKYRLEEEINKFDPDVVHTNNISGFSVSIFDIIKSHGKKLIHTARDYYLLHPNSTLFNKGMNLNPNSLSCRIWSAIKRIKSNKIDDFIGISNYVTDLHRTCGFARKASFSTVYNPIEPIHRKKEFDEHKIIIGFIGKLSDDKGFFDYCRLAYKFKENSNIEFCAAGRCSKRDEKSVNCAAKKSNVNLLGFINLTSFLSKVDAVILPVKWNEPFGRTVAECAVSGTIVFTNMNGGITEIANICKNVFPIDMFNINSATDMIKASNKLVDNPFNKNNSVIEYEKLYTRSII